MGQLTTHVLDTSAGRPAAAVHIEVHDCSGPAPKLLTRSVTGQDGRCAAPLLIGEDFHDGRYSLTFQIGGYFRAQGVSLPQPAFLEVAVIHVGIADSAAHYHVPLLISPWSYSVYRGG
jgi:5-hydroxyisourate hydrolase